MNVNHTFRSLDIGLPEDILRRKLYGDFDGAQRLIALRLADPDLPQALRDCLTAQSEMIRRLPGEYPYTRAQALERLRANIPDFTEEEFDRRVDRGQIGWIYVNGEPHFFGRFFETLCKAEPAFAQRAGVTLAGSESAAKGSDTEDRLDRRIRLMKEQGQLTCRIRREAHDEPHQPVRIIMDSQGHIPLNSLVLTDKTSPTIVVTTSLCPVEKMRELKQKDDKTTLTLWMPMSPDNKNYEIVSVGSNWTDNRHILGYMNAISGEYSSTPALDLMIKSNKDFVHPYFLILDEMNLSYVERYFSDFISCMESGEPIQLSPGDRDDVPEIDPGDNLFVIGTVNMDETTYAFSPKVLDRANVLEFEAASVRDYMENDQREYSPTGDVEFLDDCMRGVECRTKSSSEILAEMIHYANGERIELPSVFATFMLSGMFLDTNGFKNQNTGARTFEAAEILKGYGADNVAADAPCVIEPIFERVSVIDLRIVFFNISANISELFPVHCNAIVKHFINGRTGVFVFRSGKVSDGIDLILCVTVRFKRCPVRSIVCVEIAFRYRHDIDTVTSKNFFIIENKTCYSAVRKRYDGRAFARGLFAESGIDFVLIHKAVLQRIRDFAPLHGLFRLVGHVLVEFKNVSESGKLLDLLIRNIHDVGSGRSSQCVCHSSVARIVIRHNVNAVGLALSRVISIDEFLVCRRVRRIRLRPEVYHRSACRVGITAASSESS